MAGVVWTKKENNILKKNFKLVNDTITKKELIDKLPNRSWNTIKIQSRKLNLKLKYPYKIDGKVSNLLRENVEAYYWTGFIAADGCIKDNIRLNLSLASKDREHLHKFVKFLNSKNKLKIHSVKNKYYYCSFSIQDRYRIPIFTKKFDLKSRKTYNPPFIKFRKNFLFLAFFIGFVDGDGSINKLYKRQDCKLTIKCHKSWKTNLEKWIKNLYELSNPSFKRKKIKGRIIKQRYVSFNISNSEVLWFLKKFIEKNNLPVLNRKWRYIKPPSFHYKKANKLKLKIKKLLKTHSQSDINKKLNVSRGYISRISKEV